MYRRRCDTDHNVRQYPQNWASYIGRIEDEATCPVFLVFCAFCAFGSYEADAQEAFLVEVCLNKNIFYAGDYMNININVKNGGQEINVDEAPAL
ncbi:hypothetical protein J7M28_04580 [bacterium]|nr:hypothetical protein [bacterium]